MTNLRKRIYNSVPPSWRKGLGRSKLLKPVRDLFFRSEGRYIESESFVSRSYPPYQVDFKFTASIQVAIKAEQKGVENTLLRHSMALVRKYKDKSTNAVVLDVGANFGYLSLVWACTIASEGMVYSFEPHPHMFESFQKSILSNKFQDRMIPQNVAVGNSEGEVEIHLSHTTSNTLSEELLGTVEDKVKVPLITLDEFSNGEDLTHCDLIKIDVDGIELDILKGAKQLLLKYAPIVIVETNNDKRIIEFMSDINYITLNQQLNRYVLGDDIPPNAFFVPKDYFDNVI